MISEQQIDSAIRQIFESIEFQKEPAGLYDPLRYMIEIGGKRIRPRLCLTTYSLYKDYLTNDIMEVASALEVFHSFTLIHDDIMDRSPLRRGCPTVWKKWNEDTAILSGDVMLIDAYKRIAKAPKAVLDSVMDTFSKTAAEVCDGQQLDIEFESRPKVSMDEYNHMIGLKTAVLLACSAKMGAIMGGADDKDCDALYEYGYKLGMAFQIADDFLDTFGDTKVFGKPIGGDIILNKKTWLLTHAMEKAPDREELLLALSMDTSTDTSRQAKIDTVRKIYEKLGVGEDARSEIRRFSDEALLAIEGLEFKPLRKELLRRFADSLTGRAK